MKRLAATLAVAFIVIGCGLLPQPHDSSPSGAMAHMSYDTDSPFGFTGPNGTCVPEVWVTGKIVPVDGDGSDAAIRDDDGVVRRLTWGSHNPAVVDWNRRYNIGGSGRMGTDILWACGGADSVIPQ
jgi:hypothetical protein